MLPLSPLLMFVIVHREPLVAGPRVGPACVRKKGSVVCSVEPEWRINGGHLILGSITQTMMYIMALRWTNDEAQGKQTNAPTERCSPSCRNHEAIARCQNIPEYVHTFPMTGIEPCARAQEQAGQIGHFSSLMTDKVISRERDGNMSRSNIYASMLPP